MPGEFREKIVVISGASRGIGRGIAMAFAREGAQTVLASSSAENLAVAAKAIAGLGPEPFTVAGDLRTLAACEQLFARVNERFARCDVLVNNAGATLRSEALAKNNRRGFAKPEDLAALALFLGSERARHIQGRAIAVDGGATAGHY